VAGTDAIDAQRDADDDVVVDVPDVHWPVHYSRRGLPQFGPGQLFRDPLQFRLFRRDVADDGDADAGRAADAGAVRCIPGVPGHRRRLLLGRGHVQLLPLDHLQNKADDVDPPPVSSVRLFMHAFSATYQCINDRSMKSIDPLQLHCN